MTTDAHSKKVLMENNYTYHCDILLLILLKESCLNGKI